MSNVARSAASESRTPVVRAGWPAPRIAVVVVIALLLVLLGYVAGVRSAWTAHHPRVVSGTAERVPADVPFAYFDPDNGDRVAFRLDDVVWKSGDRTDSGSIPPCLQEAGERAGVQVGVIEVTRPYGSGSYQQVLSVTCPGR
jgi:hypothetical protein